MNFRGKRLTRILVIPTEGIDGNSLEADNVGRTNLFYQPMSDLREVVTNLAVLLSVGMILSSVMGVWLLGRAKGRREGFAEAQQILNSAGGASIDDQNERIDSLLLEVTRLRENQSQMSKVLRAAVQSNQSGATR